METRANRRHGHRVSLLSQQRGKGSLQTQGNGRSSRRCRGRFRSDQRRTESTFSLQPLHFSGPGNLSVSSDEFRSVLGRFPSGVTVVTTKAADGSDQGMTVSAFCSLSLEPPLVLICIERTASAYEALTTAPAFIVNILSAKQEQLARRFAEVDIDRFEGVGFSRSGIGIAVLDDV